MIYDYRSDGGGAVAREYPMGEAPSELHIDGVRYWRDYSRVQVGRTREEAFVSISAPLKGGRYDDPKNPAPHYAADGITPAFRSKREVREWAKRSETEHGGYVVND